MPKARIRRCRVSRRAPAWLLEERRGSARVWAGCASRLLRGRDRGKWGDQIGGSRRDPNRLAGAVRAESGGERRRGARGDDRSRQDRLAAAGARDPGGRRNTRKLKSITEAKAKTDRLDARTLARLLVSGLLDQVWTPDERTRTFRRLTNRRERLVRARTRAKNEAHGVLACNLCERPPVTDAFGKGGRRWLARLELPVDERLTLDGCLRQVDFLDGEITALDSEIAKAALAWPEVLRLMSVPGVNVQTAATFMAAIGDIGRFYSPRKLVSYLGLDPRVRQSGSTPARHGRISKAGASEARHMLGELAWKVMQTPGPLRAFFERVRARRGPQVAATATPRKLTVLFWHLLTREEDYAFARPAMSRNKIRRLELLAGAPAQKGRKGIAGGKSKAVFDAERQLSRQAEAAYQRLVNDRHASSPPKTGAGATAGRAPRRPSKGKAARQTP
ncbi:MAG: IS110 family transposase [Candidatus Limnocylindria bacterium]